MGEIKIQRYKDVYSPVALKCRQEFVLLTFQSYSALTNMQNVTTDDGGNKDTTIQGCLFSSGIKMRQGFVCVTFHSCSAFTDIQNMTIDDRGHRENGSADREGVARADRDRREGRERVGGVGGL